jgi:hypothetical protein
MERIFQIIAAILAGIAAYFLWRGNGDGAFISAVAGAVCFFLSVRFQVKERNAIREQEENFETKELEEKMRFEDEMESRKSRQRQ